MRRRYLLVAIVLVAVIVGFTAGQFYSTRPDASKLLVQAAEKGHELCYIGTAHTTIAYAGRTIESVTQIQHSSDGERMEYISQPIAGTIVVTHNGETRTYLPESGRTLVSHADAVENSRNKTELILRNYNARVVGRERIAGRNTYVVEITPKRRGNPSKQIWIDKETYLVLASVDKTSDGAVRSSMRFSEIQYLPHLPEQTFSVPTSNTFEIERPVSRKELAQELGFDVTLPEYLPAGYEFDSYRLFKCECLCGHQSGLIRYTDGLNSISIFQGSADMDCGGDGCNRQVMAAGECDVIDCSQARIGTAATDGVSIVVVADLPEEEIERITRSIRL